MRMLQNLLKRHGKVYSWMSQAYPEHDRSKVKEPDTWCRYKFDKSFYLSPPLRRATEEIVGIQDVE